MDRTQYISDQDLSFLNKDVIETIRLAYNHWTLSANINAVKTQIDNECGSYVNNLTLCYEATQFYQMLTVKD